MRPPLPWRPSKLRFDVLTAYCPGESWSPFIAMHIEQPASRHSAPAARKITSRPSRSAWAFTGWEPGTIITRVPSCTRRSLSTLAARRRSLMRLFVQEPMNTTSTGWPAIAWPGLEAHVLERALEAATGAPDPARPRGGARGR